MKNQPVYYVPMVRMRMNFKPFCLDELKEGAEYPISDSHHSYDEKMISIMVSTNMGCNIANVQKNHVDLFVKEVVPKFKLGQIVAKKDGGQPFRIYGCSLLQGRMWYQDGWSLATGFASGRHEEDLKEATEKESSSWEVEYNDDLVKKSHPSIYNLFLTK